MVLYGYVKRPVVLFKDMAQQLNLLRRIVASSSSQDIEGIRARLSKDDFDDYVRLTEFDHDIDFFTTEAAVQSRMGKAGGYIVCFDFMDDFLQDDSVEAVKNDSGEIEYYRIPSRVVGEYFGNRGKNSKGIPSEVLKFQPLPRLNDEPPEPPKEGSIRKLFGR